LRESKPLYLFRFDTAAAIIPASAREPKAAVLPQPFSPLSVLSDEEAATV
jgi:hypothetical protein